VIRDKYLVVKATLGGATHVHPTLAAAENAAKSATLEDGCDRNIYVLWGTSTLEKRAVVNYDMSDGKV
jgi:hypothetical protein